MAIDPISLAVMGTIASVGSTALGVAGSIIGASNSASAARDAEALAKKNKQIAEENAQLTLLAAQDEQYDLDMEALNLFGEQEAQQAASGLSLSSGSFIQTRAAARELARIDALNVHEAAQLRAEAYRNERDVYAADAAAARRAGRNAWVTGLIGVGTSLVGGASNFVEAQANRTNSRMTIPTTRRLS